MTLELYTEYIQGCTRFVYLQSENPPAKAELRATYLKKKKLLSYHPGKIITNLCSDDVYIARNKVSQESGFD